MRFWRDAQYDAAYVHHNFPARLPAGEVRTCWLAIDNRGTKPWPQETVKVSIDLDGARVAQLDLPHPVGSGERVTLHWVFRTTNQVGRHEFKVDLVEQDVTTFERKGVRPLRIRLDVVEQPVTATRRLRDRVLETHARCWLACDGMSWSSTGSGYPQFAREAGGCRITDLEGRQYVDYLMGWGSALLGYAQERIQRAIAGALHSGAILTLTHHWMPEVADTLCEMFPGAEAATFGKNGSDVCTAAVRLARAHTGRPVVLFCGYHGWQDWYGERFGFSATGIPVRGEPLLLPFEPNNLEQLAGLLSDHRGQVAAVMLEPAGVIEGSSGPIQDADPVFLKEMAKLAHQEGALVIFDEIMTGFRYLGGSVQHATGVVPDLTCLGKALSAGMPLSALIGRREIFDSSIGRIFYEPTFKGEAYSFAAAREALSIYREQDIPARIWSFGNRLREMIDGMCESLRIPAEVIGPPFRMLLAFSETDGRRRALMRTLVQQELLKRGVLTTQNLLLPSAAHDDEALEVTRRAFAHALGVLAGAMEGDRFASYLEIPPLPP
ncbi:MAG TPA: aminotransferase class III-fold pyridoxal phosphate-dependent enzyme [Thermoanaerobaculia bacterium]|nr:aminotransferase class III-fold pyridoxal phosphate-dependent enzyme [Thermoanaerobaculia bacterium]